MVSIWLPALPLVGDMFIQVAARVAFSLTVAVQAALVVNDTVTVPPVCPTTGEDCDEGISITGLSSGFGGMGSSLPPELQLQHTKMHIRRRFRCFIIVCFSFRHSSWRSFLKKRSAELHATPSVKALRKPNNTKWTAAPRHIA